MYLLALYFYNYFYYIPIHNRLKVTYVGIFKESKSMADINAFVPFFWVKKYQILMSTDFSKQPWQSHSFREWMLQ